MLALFSRRSTRASSLHIPLPIRLSRPPLLLLVSSLFAPMPLTPSPFPLAAFTFPARCLVSTCSLSLLPCPSSVLLSCCAGQGVGLVSAKQCHCDQNDWVLRAKREGASSFYYPSANGMAPPLRHRHPGQKQTKPKGSQPLFPIRSSGLSPGSRPHFQHDRSESSNCC